ncbi:hypothetical protein F5Y18DRAFT_378439 [Xylariaceae sp. FL1019]|nr:hypothetical protein F5Y18DRAFT_378439 [Xylariaceae sp. FL1019]
MEEYPEIKIHFASFAAARDKVSRVSTLGRKKTPTAQSIAFHEIPGPDRGQAIMKRLGCGDTLTDADACLSHAPGARGVDALANQMEYVVSSWTGEEHYAIFEQVSKIIEDVDPAVVVVDFLFRPAVDAIEYLNRLRVVMSPNALSDLFGPIQPYLAGFWKYPALGTGFSFPVPWRDIPENVYVNFRMLWGMLMTPTPRELQSYLKSKGLKPSSLLNFRDDVVKITQTLPEASLPVDKIPANTTAVGAMILDSAPAIEQDPTLVAWLGRAPTIVINFGSLFAYSAERAETMASVVQQILTKSDLQVLWKMAPISDFGNAFAASLQPYIEGDRLQIMLWLPIDTLTLLETDNVIASVHHGGASSFNEATVAGVPQVVVPVWEDHYNFAQLAEDLGVGIYANRESAPAWDVDGLVGAILEATNGSQKSLSMRKKASGIGDTVRARPGRSAAAKMIAELVIPR